MPPDVVSPHTGLLAVSYRLLRAIRARAANGFKRLLIDLCSHCNYGSGYGGKTLAQH